MLLSHEKQKRIYLKRFKQFGHSIEALHWNSPLTQRKRFETLSKIASLQGKSILDIGCGFADLFQFFQEKKLDLTYTGYDIVKPFIQIAKTRYPTIDLYEKNILQTPLNEKFDYVISSGLFAFGNWSFFKKMVTLSFDLAQNGYGFNLHFTNDPKFFKTSIEKALNFCQKLKPKNIEFIVDERLSDITIFLYKNCKK